MGCVSEEWLGARQPLTTGQRQTQDGRLALREPSPLDDRREPLTLSTLWPLGSAPEQSCPWPRTQEVSCRRIPHLCLATVNADPSTNPQILLKKVEHCGDPVWRCDHVHIVQISEELLRQTTHDLVQCCLVLPKGVQEGHESVPLFLLFALLDCVDITRIVLPQVL